MALDEKNIGSAEVEIEADHGRFKKSMGRIERTFRSGLRSLTRLAKRSVIAIGVAVGGLTVYMAKIASDVVEMEEVFGVALGDMAKEGEKFVNKLSKKWKFGKIELKEYLSTYFMLLKGMEVGEKDILKLSKALTELTFDFSSFRNLKFDEAFQKITATLTGEIEPLKRMGIVIGEEATKQALLEKGWIKQGQKLTEVQKIYGRYLALVKNPAMIDAMGNMEKTLGSTSNLWKSMLSNARQFSATIGAELLPVINMYLTRIIEFFRDEDVIKLGQDKMELLNKWLTTLLEKIDSVPNKLERIAKALERLTSFTKKETWKDVWDYMWEPYERLLNKGTDRRTGRAKKEWEQGRKFMEDYEQAREQRKKDEEEFPETWSGYFIKEKGDKAFDLFKSDQWQKGGMGMSEEGLMEFVGRLGEKYPTKKREINKLYAQYRDRTKYARRAESYKVDKAEREAQAKRYAAIEKPGDLFGQVDPEVTTGAFAGAGMTGLTDMWRTLQGAAMTPAESKQISLEQQQLSEQKQMLLELREIKRNTEQGAFVQ